MDKFLASYLETAIWSSEYEDEFDGLTIYDFSLEALGQAKKDCEEFREKAGKLLDNLDLALVGHDFWLTRNGHGAGFWDGDYEDSIGEELTKISETFKQTTPYLGNDNRLYFE